MDSRALGGSIQDLREKKGLTQDELSDKAGLAYSTLSKIERGAIKNPSIFTINALAESLEIGIDELVGHVSPTTAGQPPNDIEFIYCDVNGTLVRYFQRAFTSIAHDLQLPLDKVEGSFWHFNDAVNRGALSAKECGRVWARRMGLHDPLDWQHYFIEAIEPIDEMADWLTEQSKTHSIGIISNIYPGAIPELIARGIVPKLNYKVIVDSSEVGCIKPEPHIYEVAEKRAGVSPDKILLIDDTPANLAAAEDRGWHVSWFDAYSPKESIHRLNKVV